MAQILTSGVDYAQFFDDLRAVIRYEIKQEQASGQVIAPEQRPSRNGLKNKRSSIQPQQDSTHE